MHNLKAPLFLFESERGSHVCACVRPCMMMIMNSYCTDVLMFLLLDGAALAESLRELDGAAQVKNGVLGRQIHKDRRHLHAYGIITLSVTVVHIFDHVGLL